MFKFGCLWNLDKALTKYVDMFNSSSPFENNELWLTFLSSTSMYYFHLPLLVLWATETIMA